FETLEDDIEKNSKKSDAQYAEAKESVERVRTEMAAGFKVQGERIGILDRRSVAIGGPGLRDVDGVCLSALVGDERKLVSMVALSMPSTIRERKDEFPLLSSPSGSTLVACLLHASFKLQKRLFRTQSEEAKLWEQIDRYQKAIG